MFFERVERELTNNEPWSPIPVDRTQLGDQPQDCWQVESTEKPHVISKPVINYPKWWRNTVFWKWLFSDKQVAQQRPFTKQ